MNREDTIRRVEQAIRDIEADRLDKGLDKLDALLAALRDPFSQPMSSFEIRRETKA